MLLPVGLANLFVSGALILWDPSLQALTVVGLLEIAALLVLALSQAPRDEAHSLGHAPAHDASAAAHPTASGSRAQPSHSH
jgi:NADH-quinone oxidoreductase subunit H